MKVNKVGLQTSLLHYLSNLYRESMLPNDLEFDFSKNRPGLHQ